MKILLFGSRGRVGEKALQALTQSGHEIIAPVRDTLDLADTEAVETYLISLEASPPNAVINCAAISGLEACLDAPDLAHHVNALAPEAMARFCERTGAKFIHLSTDYVLDGRHPSVKDESAKTKPINTYGESKWEAELRIAEANPTALIARVSWVYGNPAHPSFPDMILAKAQQNQPLAAIRDKWSLPTHTDTIIQALQTFLQTPQVQGIYHVCDSGTPITWHDYAQEILNQATQLGLLKTPPPLTPQNKEEITFFRTPRPTHTALNNKKLNTLLPHPIPHWTENLNQYLCPRTKVEV